MNRINTLYEFNITFYAKKKKYRRAKFILAIIFLATSFVFEMNLHVSVEEIEFWKRKGGDFDFRSRRV